MGTVPPPITSFPIFLGGRRRGMMGIRSSDGLQIFVSFLSRAHVDGELKGWVFLSRRGPLSSNLSLDWPLENMAHDPVCRWFVPHGQEGAKGSAFQKKHGGIGDGRKAGGGGGTEVYHDEQCSYRQPRKDAMSLPLK